jgi:hypothetical protein
MDTLVNSVLSVVAGLALAIGAFVAGFSSDQTAPQTPADYSVISICGSAGLLPESAKDDCP